MILGIHSSPNLGGNLERMVTAVGQASGLEHEIIKLAEMEIFPCTGCVRCARSKRCVLKDGMDPVYEKLETAEGLIFGGVNYNGRFNAIAHTFLERLFPLYHQEPSLRGLPVAVVAVGGEEPERAGADIASYLKETWLCTLVGTALFKSDTPPCFTCGLGTQCPVGMPALHWPQKEFEAFTAVKKEMFQKFEDNKDAVRACERLGQALHAAIHGDRFRPRSGGGYYLPS
ncbi:MAG: flavodoxin family protein [Desulfovermiculus sp.]|nr:flavodoxin family protein [Desulfovermiculus sp.]